MKLRLRRQMLEKDNHTHPRFQVSKFKRRNLVSGCVSPRETAKTLETGNPCPVSRKLVSRVRALTYQLQQICSPFVAFFFGSRFPETWKPAKTRKFLSFADARIVAAVSNMNPFHKVEKNRIKSPIVLYRLYYFVRIFLSGIVNWFSGRFALSVQYLSSLAVNCRIVNSSRKLKEKMSRNIKGYLKACKYNRLLMFYPS